MEYKFIALKIYILIFFSFFISLTNVHAVEQYYVNNSAYGAVLNLYNLQYSQDPKSQAVFNFFESIDYDLAGWLAGYSNNSTVQDYLSGDFFISLTLSPLGITYPATDGIYQLGNNENIATFYITLFSTGDTVPELKRSGTNYIFDKIPSDRIGVYISINMETNEITIIHNPSSNPGYVEFTNLTLLLNYFYQSNKPLLFAENVVGSPVFINGIVFSGDNNFYTSQNYQYLGYEYFDNDLVISEATGLYSFYNYITGNFNFGEPFTTDYKKLNVYGDTLCVAKPRDNYIANYDTIKNSNDDNFYFKRISKIHASTKLELFYIKYPSFVKLSQNINVDTNTDNSIIVNKIISDKDKLHKFRVDFDSVDNVILFRPTYNYTRADDGITLFYKQNYFTVNCTLVKTSNNFTFVDEYGISTNISIGDVSQNQNWYDYILDGFSSIINFVLESFIFVADLVSKLTLSIKNFGNYIVQAFSSIGDLSSSISVIGGNISLFFSSMPSLVRNTIIAIFILSSVGIIIKLML